MSDIALSQTSTIKEFVEASLFQASIDNDLSRLQGIEVDVVVGGVMYHIRMQVEGIDLPNATHLLNTKH